LLNRQIYCDDKESIKSTSFAVVLVIVLMVCAVLGNMERCGVMGSTFAFASIGHASESERRLFSHHGASAFSKLRSLAKCSLDVQFVDCCSSLS